MAAVTVSRSEGRLIAVKQVPAEQAVEVEREAELLKRLDHPGLVRFIDLVETADGDRALHTEFVNSETWATRPLNDPAERAEGMAALATVVADLHQLGVAHLQLTASHVLHGENDRPVLCGLALAAEATPENCRTDVAALADLCHDPALGRGTVAEKLSLLAEEAREGNLSARELARRLDLIAPGRQARSVPARAVGRGRLVNAGRRPRPKTLLAVGAVMSSLVVAFALGARSRGPDPAPAILDPASPQQPIATAETGTAPPDLDAIDGDADPLDTTDRLLEDTLPPAASGSVSDQAALSDESWSVAAPDDAVAVPEAAAILEHGGRRYAVGATGDFVETGDWDCDGRPTAAIVRPSTGEVVVFDDWPAAGQTLSEPVRWSVDSPTGAEAVAYGSCDLLRVFTTAGSQLFNPGETS